VLFRAKRLLHSPRGLRDGDPWANYKPLRAIWALAVGMPQQPRSQPAPRDNLPTNVHQEPAHLHTPQGRQPCVSGTTPPTFSGNAGI